MILFILLFVLFRKRWFPFRNTNGECVYYYSDILWYILVQVFWTCYILNLEILNYIKITNIKIRIFFVE